jgi:hypothetical protein
VPEFERPGEFVGVDPDLRKQMLDIGLIDCGDGKSFMDIPDETVAACRGSRDYCAELVRKARALAKNIKDNGADFETTWAGFMALGVTIDSIKRGSYPLLAYMLTEEVFREAGADG